MHRAAMQSSLEVWIAKGYLSRRNSEQATAQCEPRSIHCQLNALFGLFLLSKNGQVFRLCYNYHLQGSICELAMGILLLSR
jgi:hypothetical protein